MIRDTSPVLLMEMNLAVMRAANTSKTKLMEALFELGYDRFVKPGELERQWPLTDQMVASDLIPLPASYHI